MAPRIFFCTPLTCLHCGALNEARAIDLSSALGNDPEWTSVVPGQALDVGLDDFEFSLLTLRLPDGAAILVLELWACRSFKAAAWARLTFRIRTRHVVEFVDAEVVPLLTGEVLEVAHFMTREIEYWTPVTGEDEVRIEELKRLSSAPLYVIATSAPS